MTDYNSLDGQSIEEIATKLKQGEIGIIPTDTQYGIVTSALNKNSVEKIYHLRKRSSDKPMIILISDISQLEKLQITLPPKQSEILTQLWPNPISIIIPADNPKLEYLHRGKNSLAFRLPNLKWLKDLLSISGPLVAPSANFEGEKPSSNIQQSKNYFGDRVDFYVDAGELNNPSSTLIKLIDQGFEIIRQGAFVI